MDHDLRFTRATHRRSPLLSLALLGLTLLFAAGFLADVGRGRSVRSIEPAALVT